MAKINIAIADDYPVFREGLNVIFSNDGNLDVILEADNGNELLDGMKACKPDVVIMDLKMPVMDGMEATQLIREKYPTVKVLVVSMYDDDKFISHLLEIGANGYLLKNAEPEEMLLAVYAVHENGYYFNERVKKSLVKKLVTTNNLYPTFNPGIILTEQELQALKNICAESGQPGTNLPAPAEQLLQQLFKKIGVRNTPGLVMYAVKEGITD
jgi:DNA-binding NarL/FixJ family response regulator